MSVRKCNLDGKPGWQWGEDGECHTYDENSPSGNASAKARAIADSGVVTESKKPKVQNHDGQVQI